SPESSRLLIRDSYGRIKEYDLEREVYVDNGFHFDTSEFSFIHWFSDDRVVFCEINSNSVKVLERGQTLAEATIYAELPGNQLYAPDGICDNIFPTLRVVCASDEGLTTYFVVDHKDYIECV